MNKLLKKINQISDNLSASEIEKAIAILNAKLPQEEILDCPGELPWEQPDVLSTWTEIKHIKGHPYRYQRWRKRVPGPTPGQSKICTPSKYLGKA